MLVSSALMEYSQVEQQRILMALEEGKTPPTPRRRKCIENWKNTSSRIFKPSKNIRAHDGSRITNFNFDT